MARTAGAKAAVVSPRQVLAFRMARLGLGARTRKLPDAVGEVGLSDFPPGAALAALAPRLEGAGPDTLSDAFEGRTLVRVRGMRGAPLVVRTRDLEVFTAGAAPPDERSMRAFLKAAIGSINAAKMSALDAVALVTKEAKAALAKGPLDRDALHAVLKRRLPEGLLPWCRVCQSHHVHPSVIYAVAQAAPLLIFPREEGPYLLVRADTWLRGQRIDKVADPGAELLRRFLRTYGPATVADFSAWSGLAGGRPRALWDGMGDALAPVQIKGLGGTRFALADDLDAVQAADPADLEEQVRLVSPGDPLLQMRDRALLVPDGALQKVVWKNLGPTGLMLQGGDVVGIVRVRKKGARLQVAVEATRRIDARVKAAAEAEAMRLAKARGLAGAGLVWR